MHLSLHFRVYHPQQLPLYYQPAHLSLGTSPQIQVNSNVGSNAIRNFLLDLQNLMENLAIASTLESGIKINEDNGDGSADFCRVHASLTTVLDRLTKYSEASLKMYEDIKQKMKRLGVLMMMMKESIHNSAPCHRIQLFLHQVLCVTEHLLF